MAKINTDKIQEMKAEGKTIREIAEDQKVSKSTIARVLKAAKPQTISAGDPLQNISVSMPAGVPLPPGQGEIVVPNVQQHAGRFQGGKGYYVPSDLAIIENRDNASAMWNNLTIRSALQDRLWSSALQPGHVECPDKKDPRQKRVANQIQEVIDKIPNLTKLKYCLLKSRFFGSYGAFLKYQWKGNKLNIVDWEPVHGDSILFKQTSNEVAVYTTIAGGPGTKTIKTEAGYIGRAHLLEDGREIHFDGRGQPYQNIEANERQAFILMQYDPDPSDFLNSRQAGGVKGLGLRSTIYPTWYLCNEILGNLVDWMERVGSGLTLYRFIRGNQSSYDAAVQLASSQSNQGIVMVPTDISPGGQPIEGVERIEVPSTGLDNMLKVIDGYFNTQIRRFIVGQDSTSQKVSTGLGSKIAEIQNEAFNRIVRFDCLDLAETLTTQLVAVLQEWNHPEATDFQCKFTINPDRPDVERQMKAVKLAYEMNVAFIEAEVRGLTGLSEPDDNDTIISKTMGDEFLHKRV